MRMQLRAALVAVALSPAGILNAQSLPPPLNDWRDWVLHGEEFRRCPFLSSTTAGAGERIATHAFRCAWPERLVLSVDARGGTFTQRWQVLSASWVELPGDTEHWPRDVRLNGAPAPVVDHAGPGLRLQPGTWTVSGRFEWETRPEALPLPAFSALVDLVVDGQRVPQPERPEGAVWLGKRRSVEQAAAMEVQVYRLLRDEIPAYLVTRIRLNVAGDAREELLARPLPEGFVPLSLEGPLPARLEPDGRLRVQVRPGSHLLTLAARGAGVAGSFTRPDASGGPWAQDEVWSFGSDDLLRVAAAEGADGIDPAQANVPRDWREYPAFRMGPDSTLNVVERSRGISNGDDNRLSLDRDLWLDFDRSGFTAVDRIAGTLRRDWRLDMNRPFALASARAGDQQLLVTAGREEMTGLELRSPRVDLTTVARKSAGGDMPATGWNHRFERVVGTLHLPVGHRLLAAPGADAAPESWWETWGLWNVFGVALVVVFVYWVAGRWPAAIAALALLLMHQESPGYLWLWANLLAAVTVAGAATEARLQRIARAYRTLSFVVLGLALLPLLVTQLHYALHPQLAPRVFATDYSRSMPPEENPYGLEALWQPGPSLADLLPDAPEMVRPAPPPLPSLIVPPPEAAIDSPEVSNLAESAPVLVPEPERSRPLDEDAPADPMEIDDRSPRAAMVEQRYAAGTVLQAGPGIPKWDYNSYAYFWTGPVESTDRVRFLYVGPAVMFLWRVLGLAALVALFLMLARRSFGAAWNWPDFAARTPAATPGALACVSLVLLAFGGAGPAEARNSSLEIAAPGLLGELKSRLTAAPACMPSCAAITEARVDVEGQRLEVVLRVSALANIAVPMPHASDRWQIDELSVDGRSALAIGREADASLWVPLSPGARTVRLAGRLASAESLQLAFPMAPGVIDVRVSGWVVSGVNEGRLVSGSLELVRERTAQRAGVALESASEFPAFVRVERTFNLDLDWTLDTQVTRIAPKHAAISLQVPLMKGESVLTPGVEIRAGSALVGLAAGERRATWYSSLARAESLELTLPADAARSELWNFVVNPQWNVEFEGFPAILPADVDARVWVFRFAPRPGEKLALRVSRPEAVPGASLAIDSVYQEVEFGKRSASTQLRARIRSTKGGRHVIRLPEDARVTSVEFDKKPQQLRPEKGELPLSLMPGTHDIVVRWEQARELSWRSRPDEMDLRSPASNLQFAIGLPESRWTLLAWGPGIGPAILYWSELALFIAVAWLLGRWPASPLRFSEWLLLGLGLSTQSWLVFAFVAAWLLLLRWRESWSPGPDVVWRYNAVQVLFALFTVFMILSLALSGIRDGLLAPPDMGIGDLNYGKGHLWWFTDQAPGSIEPPTVISAPMWLYRTLFFAWACWLTFAMVGWLRRGFSACMNGGAWRREECPHYSQRPSR